MKRSGSFCRKQWFTLRVMPQAKSGGLSDASLICGSSGSLCERYHKQKAGCLGGAQAKVLGDCGMPPAVAVNTGHDQWLNAARW